jgi:hypothetical protein
MRSAVAWGSVSLALLIGLGAYLAPLKPSLVALQFTFTPEAFGAVLAAWQPAGVALYRSHLPVDGLLLLSYGWFGHLMASTSALFTGYAPASRRRLAWLLPLAALADSGENLLHWVLTAEGAVYAPWVYALAGACASLKWCGLLVFTVAVVWAWAVRKRNSDPTHPAQ